MRGLCSSFTFTSRTQESRLFHVYCPLKRYNRCLLAFYPHFLLPGTDSWKYALHVVFYFCFISKCKYLTFLMFQISTLHSLSPSVFQGFSSPQKRKQKYYVLCVLSCSPSAVSYFSFASGLIVHSSDGSA